MKWSNLVKQCKTWLMCISIRTGFTLPSYCCLSNTSGAMYAGVPTVDFGCECNTEDWKKPSKFRAEQIVIYPDCIYKKWMIISPMTEIVWQWSWWVLHKKLLKILNSIKRTRREEYGKRERERELHQTYLLDSRYIWASQKLYYWIEIYIART